MSRLPVVNHRTLEKTLLGLGFQAVRQKGSHVFYRHPDGRTTTVPRHKTDWKNGRRYYPYDGQRLVQLPDLRRDHPSPDALVWHNEHQFRDVGA